MHHDPYVSFRVSHPRLDPLILYVELECFVLICTTSHWLMLNLLAVLWLICLEHSQLVFSLSSTTGCDLHNWPPRCLAPAPGWWVWYIVTNALVSHCQCWPDSTRALKTVFILRALRLAKQMLLFVDDAGAQQTASTQFTAQFSVLVLIFKDLNNGLILRYPKEQLLMFSNVLESPSSGFRCHRGPNSSP